MDSPNSRSRRSLSRLGAVVENPPHFGLSPEFDWPGIKFRAYSPTAEATGSNPVQFGFESHVAHQLSARLKAGHGALNAGTVVRPHR